MIIAHNMFAMNTYRQIKINIGRKERFSEQLSTGYRINRAADDAAGLSISEHMRSQIRGLDQGARNIQDGISLLNTADGALNEVHAILQRMNELSVQAANDTNTLTDREAIQVEIDQLAEEITHIGQTTTFNTMRIFDDAFNTDVVSITKLIECPSADRGYLSEAINVNGRWLPSATLDFSNIDETNIDRLNGKGFSFNCCRGCDEVFDFVFATDGTPSSATNLNGKVEHNYVIDISSCTSGADVVNAIYSYVSQHLPTGTDLDTVNRLPGSLIVSHSNYMLKTDDGSGLIIYASRSIQATGNSYTFSAQGYGSEEGAKNAYPSKVAGINSWAGGIDCSSLASLVDAPDNIFHIQNGAQSFDSVQLVIKRMNAALLGVDALNVRSHRSAGNAISMIQDAINDVSSRRTSLGAYTNRLEHIYNYNLNASENTQAAESRIRDANIAEAMLYYSMNQILEQAGFAILSQANANPQSVLKLLQ